MFMKKTGLLLLILISIVISSCEKDDICVGEEIPLLVIEFFDNDVTEETAKAVKKLRVLGEGKVDAVNPKTDRTDLKSIKLPLRSNENSTAFNLISNSADDDNNVETGNTDTLTFNYDKKEVFVSRACGYVIHYENLSHILQTDTDNWIKKIEIKETLVENQAITHVKIFH